MKGLKPEEINIIVATDCGSTTTKAILIEKEADGSYRLKVRGEAPTTVEAPFEDVTMGVLNAIAEVEELSGRKILDESGKIISPAKGGVGTDIYVSTSSAGGGLQMMVAGVVRSMTAESAERAALGAGAIVMDVIASNDRRLPHQQIERGGWRYHYPRGGACGTYLGGRPPPSARHGVQTARDFRRKSERPRPGPRCLGRKGRFGHR